MGEPCTVSKRWEVGCVVVVVVVKSALRTTSWEVGQEVEVEEEEVEETVAGRAGERRHPD